MPLSSLLPGPHDPYNATSVKLAEATRIRLFLPGLAAPDKEEGSFKRANTADLTSKQLPESAAAAAKARKKLLKIQGIANQADKAHACVIVDAGLLAGDAAEEQGDAEGSSQAARGAEAAGGTDKRTSRQGASGGYTPSLGAAAGADQVKNKRSAGARSAVDAAKFSSRLSLPSPGTAGGPDGDAASSGPQSAAASTSRKGTSDKPHIPIWERLTAAATLAEEKKVAVTTHKVFQPVALKTFSPTLGSLGSNLTQDPGRPVADESVAARSAGSRSRSAAKSPGQPPEVAAALQQRHFDATTHHLSSKRSVAASPPDLALRSKSFTGGYQRSPSQLLEKLTFGN